MNQVYIIASSSHSAAGVQQYCDAIDDQKVQVVNVAKAPDSTLYFPMKDIVLKKSYDDMFDLLSTQVEHVISQAKLSATERANTVLFLGSTSLDIDAVTPNGSENIWLSRTDKMSHDLAKRFGLSDLHYTFNTACTSSANALMYAGKMIKHGKMAHALVIGCEFYNQLSIEGFDSLDLISSTGVRPFSNSRDGLILGEGVGVVLLSNAPSGNTCLALLGGYSSCDDHSLTITDESGAHIVEVVEKALTNANISASDIDLVKIHGTASEKSDLSEYNALQLLFANTPNIIGFKSFLGHTLGACGVIEIALLAHVIQNDLLPHCQYQHNECNGLIMPFVTSSAAITQSSYMLLNHFGFGGNNAAIILKRVHECG